MFDDSRVVGFLRAWAIYALVHTIATATAWRQGLDVGFVLVPPAIWLLLRPRSVAAFVTLTTIWSILVGSGLPKVANHELLTLVMNLTMLAGLLASKSTVDAGRLERAYERFAPVLRLQIVLVYSIAVFHKLNTDFLDPNYSAAVALYREVALSYPMLPLPAGILIAATLAAEALMPIGLCVRRLRPYIVGLGIAFHLMLSLNPNPYILSFSAMLYALYTLFVPSLFEPARVRDVLAGATKRSRLLRGGLILVVASLVTLACFIPRPTGDDPAEYLRYAGRLVFLVVAFGYIAGWLSLDKAQIETRGVSWRAVRQSPPLAWLLTALLIFNGMCPYVGLKTGSAFAMYSNLHTEDGICNHLIMPCRAIRIAHFQDDLVEILDSSQPDLREEASHPWRWTYFELRRELADIAQDARPGDSFFVRYRRGGIERTVRYPEQASDEAFTAPPWLERTLLHFRPVPIDPRMRVEHWD